MGKRVNMVKTQIPKEVIRSILKNKNNYGGGPKPLNLLIHSDINKSIICI